MTVSREKKRRVAQNKSRQGVALLLTLFVATFITLMVVNVLDTTTLGISALRNSIEYDRALYLANAGVQEVAALLESDVAWRGTVTDGDYPNDDTYEATALDGAEHTVNVTSVGVAGETTRTVQATIEL